MGLKGNLGSVDLANIFQMLSINQKEGTLVICDGLSRKSIYFSRAGVSMLSRGKVRHDSLGRILLRYNRITPDQLDRALEKQKTSRRLLGEVLEEMCAVTKEDVENALRVQIEEEIYNLFIWKNAEFEFIEGTPTNEFGPMDPPLTTLTFNVNSLIMEAARRIDEWAYIRSRIISMREIFRFTGTRADMSDELFQTPFADKVLQSVDGNANVLEIVERSYVNKFEVCKILATLLDQGAVEPTPMDNLRSLATEAARDGDDTGTIKFLQRVLDEGQLDAEVHSGLAIAFENIGELEKAACHHKLYAETRLEEGDPDEAVRAYTHIREILPTDLFCRERRLQLLMQQPHEDRNGKQDLLSEAREVAGILSEVGQIRKAVGVLAEAVRYAPDDLEARNHLATLDLQAGYTKEAITELRHIAAARRASGDLAGATSLYRRILSIDRSQEEVLRDLESLVTVKKQRSARRRRFVMTAIVTIIAAVAGYAVILYEFKARGTMARGEAEALALLTKNDEIAKRTLGQIQEQLQDLASNPNVDPVEHHGKAKRVLTACEVSVRSAIGLYQEVIEKFPSSTTQDQAKQKIRSLDTIRDLASKIEAEARTSVQNKADRMFRLGCLRSANGELTHALEKFREAKRLATDSAWARSAAIHLDKRIRQHEEVLAEARSIQTEALSLEKDGRIAESSAMLLGLLKTHGFAEIVSGIRLPLLLTSQPTGATAACLGNPPVKTPAVVHFAPRGGLSGRLEAPGFEPTTFEVRPIDLSESVHILSEETPTTVHVELQKGCLWKTPIGGAVQAPPLIVGDSAYIGSRGGRLIRMRAEDGKIIWGIDLPTLGGVTTTPVMWKDILIVTVSNPNALIAVDPVEKKILWKFNASGSLGAVSARPLVYKDSLMLTDESGLLICLDLESREPRTRWLVRPGGEIRVPLVDAGETVLVPSLDGNIYEVEPLRGRTRRTLRVGSAVTAAPILTAEMFLVPTAGHGLRAIDRKTAETVWSARASGEVRASPLVLGDRVLFGALDGVLRAVDLATGNEITTFRTGGPLAGSPIIVDSRIVMTCHDGSAYALRMTDEGISLHWRYRTEARITAPPVFTENRILVASEDGHLYALSP
jgi:eukaryotic-like serine/threonine-protein kinase